MGQLRNIDPKLKTIPNPRNVGIIMGALAFAGPLFIMVDLGHSSELLVSSVSMAFQMLYSGGYVQLYLFGPMQWMVSLPLTGLRFVFVHQMVTVYHEASLEKRVKLIGILSEIPALIIVLLHLFLGGAFTIAYVPCPLLLGIGLLILWKRPPLDANTMWGDKTEKGWWEDTEMVVEKEDKETTSWLEST